MEQKAMTDVALQQDKVTTPIASDSDGNVQVATGSETQNLAYSEEDGEEKPRKQDRNIQGDEEDELQGKEDMDRIPIEKENEESLDEMGTGLTKKDAEGLPDQRDDEHDNVGEGLKEDEDEGLPKDGSKCLNQFLNAKTEDTSL